MNLTSKTLESFFHWQLNRNWAHLYDIVQDIQLHTLSAYEAQSRDLQILKLENQNQNQIKIWCWWEYDHLSNAHNN